VNGQMFFPANNAQSWDPGNGSGSGLRLGYSLTSDFAYIVANNTGVAPKNLVLQPDGGNVGIGTTNPQHMLHVAGTIGAEEVVITSTGADYVFGPDYRLQPLNEVKAYIEEHHHLPDIPSAADVKEKGIGVGDMQTKLLAKIEELTLHVIQAEERNNRLEQQVKELREQLTHVDRTSESAPK
jgi:hypothetical protein